MEKTFLVALKVYGANEKKIDALVRRVKGLPAVFPNIKVEAVEEIEPKNIEDLINPTKPSAANGEPDGEGSAASTVSGGAGSGTSGDDNGAVPTVPKDKSAKRTTGTTSSPDKKKKQS